MACLALFLLAVFKRLGSKLHPSPRDFSRWLYLLPVRLPTTSGLGEPLGIFAGTMLSYGAGHVFTFEALCSEPLGSLAWVGFLLSV